jgi:hypothetical protein
VRFFELYHVTENKKIIQSLAQDVHNNFMQMDPLEVIGKVRQLSIYAAHEPRITEQELRLLEHVFEVLNLSPDQQIWAAAQQLWAQVEMAKERRKAG